MNACPPPATNGNWQPINRFDVRRSSHTLQGSDFFSRILLILLASWIPAAAQNTASLTIQGIMPAAQRLSISPIQTTLATNQIIVTLAAKNNAAGGYAVSIQSKAASAGTKGLPAAYQLKYGGRSLTLAPGTTKLLADCSGDRSTKTILEISNPTATSNGTLTLTVISQ